MKTVGIIWGMSRESTSSYYTLLNQGVQQKLWGLNSAPCLISSVNFAPLEQLQSEEKWDEIGDILADHAHKLELAGADLIALSTNTMHIVADRITSAISVPFLHITHCLGKELTSKNIKKIWLLGTKYTMEKDFYKWYLQQSFAIQTIIPDASEREYINHIIFDELCKGIISQQSSEKFVAIMQTLIDQGAEIIVLGCTEIGLLVTQDLVDFPLIDTTTCHVQWLLQDMFA